MDKYRVGSVLFDFHNVQYWEIENSKGNVVAKSTEFSMAKKIVAALNKRKD